VRPRVAHLLAVSILLMAPLTSAAGATDPRAQTTEGVIVGRLVDGLEVFLGVPYAAPPVGPLRWREAQPPAKHGPLPATSFRLPCSQIPLPAAGDAFGSGPKVESAEDCLYLNVWAPPRRPKERLPVMVWLHGGQYMRGSSSQYIGNKLARHGRVVVVTMDYRLGPLGFLAHPALTKESPQRSSGNQTIFDHLQGLRWLHDNIARFGGDPARVTVFGESAGSASTCILIAAPQAQGLFQRAILQSLPCLPAGELPLLKDQEKFGRRLAKALDCARDDLDAELACMRGKSADEVMNALRIAKVFGDDKEAVDYRPTVDGVVVLEAPGAAIRAGRYTRMPVMLGTTDDEEGRYIVGFGIKTAVAYQAHVRKEWPKHADALLAMYPVRGDEDVPRVMAELYSDWIMTCGTRRDARTFSRDGNPTYVYRFAHAPDVLGGKHGAFHGAELFYLFPDALYTLKAGRYGPADEELTRLVAGYWGRFAATGDPSGAGPLAWPRYDALGDSHLTLDLPARAGSALRRAQCELWDRIEP
jgi:para-nitrobenzyl esterase